VAALRLLVVVAVLALAALVVGYFATGQRRFLSWALRLFVLSLAAGFAFFAVLIADRLLGG
jgi:hypothetical protein